MEIDKTTLSDLSVFNSDAEFSVFSKIDYTQTSNGKQRLHKIIGTPLQSIDEIRDIQDILKLIIAYKDKWPKQISNGSIMVIEKYLETAIPPLPNRLTGISVLGYSVLQRSDYGHIKYAAGHCFDFIQGMNVFVDIFPEASIPKALSHVISEIASLISIPEFKLTENFAKSSEVDPILLLDLGGFIRFKNKSSMLKLVQLHAQLDAWYGMATAVQKLNLIFPNFADSQKPQLTITGLYHIMLDNPVSYDVSLHKSNNFLFLTGANMAGKSTFIKSVGTAVFLAHLGMGVPAKKMDLSLFDGLLSNINIIDNVVKGESYFFNEVQRIKSTIEKINDGRNWLILIDELFKGTNVQDAMKCSLTVIEGLLKIENSLFVLSTHLYEIAESLKKHNHILFRYFETNADGDQLQFNYRLSEGVSNDRIGYLILKREGVVKLLNEL